MHAHCMVLMLFFLMDDMQNPAFHIFYIFFEPSAVAENPLGATVCTANEMKPVGGA